jgi:hypothetical protein
VRTALDVYQRCVGRLTVADQRVYYDEQKALAEMFRVPRERMPDTFAAFNRCLDDTLESDRIAVTAALRDVVDATLRPRLPFIARPLVDTLSLTPSPCSPSGCARSSGFPGAPPASLLATSWATLRRIIRRFRSCCANSRRHAAPNGGRGRPPESGAHSRPNASHEDAWRGRWQRARHLYARRTAAGLSFQREAAPGVAEDRATIEGTGTAALYLGETIAVCDFNPLDGSRGTRVYARRVGLIQDDTLDSVSLTG